MASSLRGYCGTGLNWERLLKKGTSFLKVFSQQSACRSFLWRSWKQLTVIWMVASGLGPSQGWSMCSPLIAPSGSTPLSAATGSLCWWLSDHDLTVTFRKPLIKRGSLWVKVQCVLRLEQDLLLWCVFYLFIYLLHYSLFFVEIQSTLGSYKNNAIRTSIITLNNATKQMYRSLPVYTYTQIFTSIPVNQTWGGIPHKKPCFLSSLCKKADKLS